MKKLNLLLLALSGLVLSAAAQPGGMRMTVEERVARIHQKLDSAFKLEAAKFSTLDTALTVLFKAQDAKRQELMGSGGMTDREAFMAEMKKYSDAQDEILKAMLTEEQFTIWKEKIQPSMRPQRPPGGGGN